MSDVADRAEWRIAQDIKAAMAHARKTLQLEADRHCHYCDDAVAHGALFCNTDCRDDYQTEQEALRRAGR
ncbi:DUF2116 family Zn-ribbon domain-containing protein [Collimonas sp.]|jgi:hypothetical protein|uniref:DUF2116 family Zn-ribbon domain-containing protein n=1 Tax=Collimonas sp. TaxID=1963772 RepID=UPI002CD08DB4|nr:DUF2116 family Zn-ribbon domain-containing protein [Collimonas sp.]HWX03202.1 DUF2116 family Zn-ribbon domain-containing protein [Collimonas sp.]